MNEARDIYQAASATSEEEDSKDPTGEASNDTDDPSHHEDADPPEDEVVHAQNGAGTEDLNLTSSNGVAANGHAPLDVESPTLTDASEATVDETKDAEAEIAAPSEQTPSDETDPVATARPASRAPLEVRLRRSSEGIADRCLITGQAQSGMSWSTSIGLIFPALPGASSLVLVFTEPIVQGYRHGLGLRANCQLREHPDLVVLHRLDSYP